MLKEEKELRLLVLPPPKGKITSYGSSRGIINKHILDLVRAVREDERKVMQDPKNWPDWKIAFASDVYGVPVEKFAAAIRGRK